MTSRTVPGDGPAGEDGASRRAPGTSADSLVHDLNNDLTVLLDGLVTLESDARLGGDMAGLIAACRRAAQRSAALARALDPGRESAHQDWTLSDGHEVIQGLLSYLRIALGPGVELTLRLEADCVMVPVASLALERCLINLILNAKQAVAGRGQVTIATATIRKETLPTSSAGQNPADRFFRLTVSDNGTGIAPELCEEIFQSSYSSKAGAERSGLGLTTVRQIARASGGEGWARSRPGEGTEISICLPCREGASEADAGGPGSEARPGSDDPGTPADGGAGDPGIGTATSVAA